mgnify:CR=1 FL=1
MLREPCLEGLRQLGAQLTGGCFVEAEGLQRRSAVAEMAAAAHRGAEGPGRKNIDAHCLGQLVDEAAGHLALPLPEHAAIAGE